MGFFPKVYKALVDLTGGVKIGGVAVTSSAAELNLPDGTVAPGVDGLSPLQVARATYDFAEHGGAIGAIGLGVTLPDNAIVQGGFVDVVTTCVTAGADAGTMALSILNANDLVTATAVNAGGDIWDEGLRAIVPKFNTPQTTSIKLTAAKQITATIAGQAFTAGKFTVFLYYTIGD